MYEKDLDVKKGLDYKYTMIVEELNPQIDPWDIYKNIYSCPYSFILDTPPHLKARESYSFVGFDPFLLIKAKGRKIESIQHGKREEIIGNPINILNLILKRYATSPGNSIFPFNGGAVGFMGYDLKNSIEKLPRTIRDDIGTQDLVFGFYDTLFAYNNLKNKGYIVSTGLPETENSAREKRAKERLSRFKGAISTPMVKEDEYHLGYMASDEIEKNFTKADYIRAIERVLRYISAGDVYQINLSQRFSLPLPCPPLNIYERLREINPAPMGAFLNLGDLQILSNSPERFFEIKGETIRTFPVKGTKARGSSPEEDHKFISELRGDRKENSEHIMIVDLERNDLGRVCRYGSVRVEELKRIETYPTLHHMVSTVSGRLREDIEISGVIEAVFPGGSITGAPKIRAMEIIDELEPTARGVYTGAIGYIDFSGRADFNIAIRTAIAHNGMIHYQAGGGIVANSDPEREYEETLLKAKAFFNAIKKTGLERVNSRKQRGQSLFYDSATLRP